MVDLSNDYKYLTNLAIKLLDVLVNLEPFLEPFDVLANLKPFWNF